MSALTNIQLWDYVRDHNPNFKNITSKGTADLFTEKGFEALQRNNLTALNEFFELSMRVMFQKIDVAKVKNPLEGFGLVQRYDTPNGGYIQRIAIGSVKPTTPLYRNLQNGSSVDPWKVRKPKSEERFFQQNFDYQSFLTIQDYQLKTMFISEYGISDYVAGCMRGLANGYISQSYANILETLNAGLNSVAYPLKDSQQVTVGSWHDAPTADDLKSLILTFKDIATMIETSPSTDAFNAGGFNTGYDVDDFVILSRAGIKNRIALNVTLGAFNPDTLSIPMEMKEVQDFGGLKPYVLDESENKVYLQPIYDSNGEQVAYVDASVTVNGPAVFNGTKWVVNITSGGTTADTNQTVVESELAGKEDPNADIIAVIAQKGLIFENIQNPYSVIPAPYNPAGLYTNYWASSPNNAIVYDYMYGCIVVRKPNT